MPGELHSPLGAGAVGKLALDDVVAQRPLGGVVGRGHQGVAQEHPKGWPQLEQVGAGVGCAAALILCAAQLQLNLDAPLQPGKVACVLA